MAQLANVAVGPLAPNTVSPKGRRYDMVRVAKILQNNAEYVVGEWLPGGELRGDEYSVCNPTRNDDHPGSFKINIKKCVWSEFAGNDEENGGDLTSLYQYLTGLSSKDLHVALHNFAKEHGLSDKKSQKKTVERRKPKQAPKPPTENISEEELTELPPDTHPEYGQVTTGPWEWRNADNEIVFHTQRFELEEDRKDVIPVRYVPSQNRWHWSYPAGPRPLLNAPDIAEGAHVIFSEGEKTADHLASFPQMVSTTSSGGSGRLFETDLSPLMNAKQVDMFPDADEPGMKYAGQLLGYCAVHAIPAQILNVEALGWSDGEDAADHPELCFKDYEPHFLGPMDWSGQSDKNRDMFDVGVIKAAAHLSLIHYDREKKALADLLGIGVRTLDAEVKKQREAFERASPVDMDVFVEEEEPEMTPEQLAEYRESIFPDIKKIASAPNILEKVVEFCHDRLGLVGEDALIKTTYITLNSRLLDKIISLLVKGGSAGGKSFTTGKVVRMFPEGAYFKFTSASARALIYTEEKFEHRIIIIAEANQLNGADDNDLLAMTVRSLLSEAQIIHETTVKDELSGEMVTRRIVKDGPTGLLMTTTADKIHHENETRMLSAYIDESPEQTRAILKRAAYLSANPHVNEAEEVEAELENWQLYHDWVSLGIHTVTIPYMPAVTEGLDHVPTRFRRDIAGTLQALIKSSTIMHQLNREIDDYGDLVATLDDYTNARDLIDAALEREAGAKIAPRGQMILRYVYNDMSPKSQAGREPHKVSSRQISKATGIPQKSVSYQLGKLIEQGYLQNKELVPGRAMRLKLGHEFDLRDTESSGVLPTAEWVEKKMAELSD